MDNFSGLISHPSTFLIKDSRSELIIDGTLPGFRYGLNSSIIFSSEGIPMPHKFSCFYLF